MSICCTIKASNVDVFKNKQNIPNFFDQPNVNITCEKNFYPSQKPYMGTTKKRT
jgi:hypothetical protein